MRANRDEGLVGYWDELAHRPWGQYISAVEQRQLDQVLSLAAGPGVALDAGCGGGRWSALLTARNWQVVGYDVTAPAVARSQATVPSGRFILQSPDCETLPMPDQSVDLVLCIEVRPVVQSTWFLPEVRRVLKPGGNLLVVVWNGRSARGVMANAVSLLRRQRRHEFYGVSYTRWRAGLRSLGFQPVTEHGLCWMPLGRASRSPLAPTLARIEKGLRLHRLPTLSPWVIVHAKKA